MKKFTLTITKLFLYLFIGTSVAQIPATELVYPKPQKPVEFGNSVAVYDQYTLASSESENDVHFNGMTNTYFGTIRLFKNNQFVRRYTYGGGQSVGIGKKNTIDIGPNCIVAGAPYKVTGGKSAGWVVIANKLTSGDYNTTLNYNLEPAVADIAEGLEYGCSVSTDGDWVAIGAKGRNNSKGGVYMFQRTGYLQWQRKGWVSTPALADFTYFGSSVKISGTQMIASAGKKFYIYKLINGTWSKVGEGSLPGQAGISQVDITENYAVAGCGSGGGPVVVYRKTGTNTWSHFQTLTGINQFGLDVAISNQNLIISDNNKIFYYQLQTNFTQIGSMYIPSTNTATGRTNKARVGYSIDIYGENIIIGASNTNYTSGTNQGAAFTDFFYNGWQNSNNLRADNTEMVTEFSIYPNPSASNISLATSGDLIKVFSTNLNGERLEIPFYGKAIQVENLPAGVYFLEIETTEGSFKTKFVKQ